MSARAARVSAGLGRRAGARRRVAASRRGAALPMVAILLTVIVGMAAFAIDLSRRYLLRAELQTAADAAALTGARTLQFFPDSASTLVPARATTAAALNFVNRAAASVAAADVLPRSSTAAGAVSSVAWSAANAVSATARVTVPFVVAGVFGATAPSTSRSSTAWIASVNGAACLKPISLPYTDVASIFQGTGNGSGANQNGPDFTQLQIATLARQSTTYRTLVLPPYPSVPPSGMYFDSWWKPMDFPAMRSLTTYGNWVGSGECSGSVANIGDIKVPLERDPSEFLPVTTDRIDELCAFRVAGSAWCFTSPTSSTIGAPFRALLTDDLYDQPLHGSTIPQPLQKVRAVARLRILCYFRNTTDTCNGVTGWAPPWNQTTNYPVGTLLVLVDAPASMDLTPDVQLGTTPGFTQRLMLVQ